MRRRLIILLLLICLGSVAVGAVVWNRLAHGIRVTVVNNGPEPLTNVVAHVRENTHSIGNLKLGESRTFRVLPKCESHLELSFNDHLGKRHRANAGGYFEPGYRMTIEV